VNISNGGTVTAITRTNSGGANYTTVPSVTVSAPTTAGGVQATASATMFVGSATVSAGGSGYAVGNVLTIVGGTNSSVATLTVATLSGSAVATVTITTIGSYTSLPSNPVSVTGGAGTGATFTLAWSVSAIVVDTAGSGYVEQPTVTFSSGSATAYATVGSGTIIRSLGSTSTQSLDFYTPASLINSIPVFRIRDNAGTGYFMMYNQSGSAALVAQGGTNDNALISGNGSGSVRFTTNGVTQTEQMRVSHTASAVNYVQVTGGATGSFPIISPQGSDGNISLQIYAKGTGAVNFWTSNGGSRQFQVTHTAGTVVNYATATGNIAGASPAFAVAGTDTDIDLTLTPKGAGAVRFGTYTASVLTPTGYITIKDSGGTSRRLLVG
jgi:hypothetical protein